MSKPSRFTAVDSKGALHKRSSVNRVYTHCVVIHFVARPAVESWRDRPAYSRAEWAGSLALAQKNAAGWRGDHVEGVEIIEAVRVS